MSAEVIVALMMAGVLAVATGVLLISKKHWKPAIAFGVLAVIFVVFANGMYLVDESRAKEDARVTTEVESHYDKIHVVELSVWNRSVRYTLTDSSKTSKVCDGKLVQYNGDWLIQDNPSCTVILSR